jgi:histone deacetylase 1/2
MIIVSLLGYTCSRKKSDVFSAFVNFQKLIERKLDRKILTVQSDWGGEYVKLNTFFQTQGISHHVSCPHAHQQNGSAERKHRHIVEVGLALLANAHMPLKFWDEAFLTATYLINMLPSRVIQNDTPVVLLPLSLILHCSFITSSTLPSSCLFMWMIS